jgi:predicted small integral membrane protein
MHLRICKILLVVAVGLFVSIVVFGNITDYDHNYDYVRHILAMDTISSNSPLKGRAITSEYLHHSAYILIIATQCAIALLCWAGAWKLLKTRDNPELFNRSKTFAFYGLTLGIILWFTGFLTFGGEWFLMWQSRGFNGQQPAFRLVTILSLILIFIAQKDDIEN